jgi:hypothetical protein
MSYKVKSELRYIDGKVLMYRKLSLLIIDYFAIFGVIELLVFVAKIIDNSR